MSEKYNRYKNKKSGTREDLFSQKNFKHVEFIDDKTERENNYSTDITHNNIKDEEKEMNDKESVIIPSEDEQQTIKKKNDKTSKNKTKKNHKKEEKREKDTKKKIKKDKKGKKEKPKEEIELDINDILNNNNNNVNNGGILLTELLNIGGERKEAKVEDKQDKQQKEEKTTEATKENKNLNNKLDSIQVTESIKIGVNGDKIKSEESNEGNLIKNKISNSDQKMSNTQQKTFNKTLENNLLKEHDVFLTEVDEALSKENKRYINNLKNEQQIIKRYIEKLIDNEKLIQNSEMFEKNMAENKLRKSYLTSISKTRKELNDRLESINDKINSLSREENSKKKGIKKNLTEIVDDNYDDRYKLELETIHEHENKSRKKHGRSLFDKAFNKSKNELDFKERNLKYYKQKSFNETNQKEKDLILKRKNEINAKLERTKKNINERSKKEKNYLYFKYKENFEKQERLLLESIKNKRKPPLITRGELREYDEMNKQNQNSSNPEEQKKYSEKIKSYRSQTLQSNRHFNQGGKVQKLNKINTFIKIKKNLKTIRDKDNLLQTEQNYKKGLNVFRYSHINSFQKNTDSHFNLNKSLRKKNKLKPIQVLNRRQDETIECMKSMKRRNITKKKCKSFNFDDLFEDKDEDKNKKQENNDKCLESLNVDKFRTDSFDRKFIRRNDMSAAFLTSPYLMNEIGGLLVESIQSKLNIINSLSIKKDEK